MDGVNVSTTGRLPAGVNTAEGRSGYPSAWKVVLGPLMGIVIAMVYLWIRASNTGFQDPESARIIFWHVPMAMLGLLWFWIGAYHAVRYLWGSDSRGLTRDLRSRTCAEIGLVCTILATVTGAVFAQVQWGVAWNWDPKQVSIVVLIAIYIAYFALRGSVEEPTRRGVLAASYAVFGAIMSPVLMYVAPNLPIITSLHPPGDTLTRGLDTNWRLVYWLSTACFFGITWWIYDLMVRGRLLEQRLTARLAGVEG